MRTTCCVAAKVLVSFSILSRRWHLTDCLSEGGFEGQGGVLLILFLASHQNTEEDPPRTRTQRKVPLAPEHRKPRTQKTYRVPQKKCPIAIFSLNLFQRSDCTFSHVFRNQNFEPVPTKHVKHTHSEY